MASQSPQGSWSTSTGDEVLVTNLGAGRGPSRPHAHALSLKVEAIEIHHLVPRSHKVTHELLFRVVACVDLREGSELGVRTEDEVDGGGSPLELARGAIATLVYVLIRGGCLPLRVQVEQVHEEVVGQRLRPVGEDAVFGLSEVGVQGAPIRTVISGAVSVNRLVRSSRRVSGDKFSPARR
jgi:hypothetical protein